MLAQTATLENMSIREFVDAMKPSQKQIVPPPSLKVELVELLEEQKQIVLSSLKGKDFIKWLRKQVRKLGRRGVVGYVGDHIDNPIEMWLKDLGFKSARASSMQYLVVDGQEFNLDYRFAGLIMMVCDQGPQCDLDAYEHREIGAFEMLQKTLELLSPEAGLVA